MFTTKVRRSLCLLSIDNGGIRGLSPLLILREILHRLKEEEGLPDIPRPCEVFDLAGGTGTGGIIVIMLFRLQMSIDAAIKAYTQLVEHVFSEKKWFFQEGTFKATRLEEAMVSIIQQREGGDPRQVLFFNKEGPKCFVTAMPPYEQGVYFPAFFRSWTCDEMWIGHCTVVEAVRATTAVRTFFKAAQVGHPLAHTFLDVKLRCNNPEKYVVDNARDLYGDRPISCLLSLGTGSNRVIGSYPRSPVSDPFRQWLPIKLLRALQDVITDCEQKSTDMEYEYLRHMSTTLYIRLNDDDSLGAESLAEWRRFDDLRFRVGNLMILNLKRLDLLLQVLKGTRTAIHPRQSLIHKMYAATMTF